ncbi:MAG: hypothetical protein KGZ58_06600 [Ignavibacteriales bacterium]|nr:hypothetical protein [Ignavibacteriales bacterium]
MPFNIDITEIKTSIDTYNSGNWKFLDYSTSTIFTDRVLRLSTLPQQILTISEWWKGINTRTDQDATKNIFKKLKENLPKMNRLLITLDDFDYLTNYDQNKLFSLIDDIFPIILGANTDKYLVFISKFMHWCRPNVFPIYDRRTRIAINILQTISNIERVRILKKGKPKNTNECINEYKKLVTFYQTLINEFKANHCNKLIEYDWKSQSRKRGVGEAYVVQNTILRVLDKHFFIDGEE